MSIFFRGPRAALPLALVLITVVMGTRGPGAATVYAQPASCPAVAPGPSLTPSNFVDRGQMVLFISGGFAPGTSVEVTIMGPTPMSFGVVADDRCIATFEVDTSALEPGGYDIRVAGRESITCEPTPTLSCVRGARARLTVNAPPSSPPTPPDPGEELDPGEDRDPDSGTGTTG